MALYKCCIIIHSIACRVYATGVTSVRPSVCTSVTLADCHIAQQRVEMGTRHQCMRKPTRIVYFIITNSTEENKSSTCIKIDVSHFGSIQRLVCRAISASGKFSCYLWEKKRVLRILFCEKHVVKPLRLFLPHDAMLARYYAVVVCMSVCVCYTRILYQNG